MKATLSPPTAALARRILSPVPYRDRFPAGRLRPPIGITPGDVRSLQELHGFLAPDDRSLPGVNLARLPEWVERAIGDRELAEHLSAAIQGSANYVEGCLLVYDLLGLRLEQAGEACRPSVA